jgi:hypothetical protein
MQVLNQYHFSPDSRTACVTISIMALFHQYAKRPHPLSEAEWKAVMTRGTELYRRWRAQDPLMGRRLPTVQQVLALHECTGFVQVFGSQPTEYAGLVRDAHGLDQPEGSLRVMLREMARLCAEEAKTVACLLVLPRIICLSVLALPVNGGGDYELRFFDSHDLCSQYCDYRVFRSDTALLLYLLQKYPVAQWQEGGDESSFIEQRSIEQLQASYGYSAVMFIK